MALFQRLRKCTSDSGLEIKTLLDLEVIKRSLRKRWRGGQLFTRHLGFTAGKYIGKLVVHPFSTEMRSSLLLLRRRRHDIFSRRPHADD